MNVLRLVWWRFLMDLRPVVRFLAERFPRWAGPAVRMRTLLHLLVGNLIQVGASVCGLAIWKLLGVLVGVRCVGVGGCRHRVHLPGCASSGRSRCAAMAGGLAGGLAGSSSVAG